MTLVPVPWCPVCDGNHLGTQCGQDVGTLCGDCDAFTYTGADGTCDDCGAAKNDGSGAAQGVGRVWQSILDYLNELPPVEIHESEMPADADAIVPCSLGEAGCGGSEELSLMTGDPEDGYVCPHCVNVSNAAYNQHVNDIMGMR